MLKEFSTIIAQALSEDKAAHDITTLACLPQKIETEATILLKEQGKLAGTCFIPALFQVFDPSLTAEVEVEEGKEYGPGTKVARIKGSAASILAAERSVLNILQHLGGVATLTAQFVKEVEGYTCDILDTRKTLPGLKSLQKYAVKVGGGKNHRLDLSAAVLIKNNHLALLKKEHAKPVWVAVTRAKEMFPDAKIEVEVESLEELEEALSAGASTIMLDNMDLAQMMQAVKITNGKAYLEASGKVTLARARPIAEAGVNGISIGALTHSARALDISLKIK